MAPGDFDGDGWLDLAVASGRGGLIAWYRGAPAEEGEETPWPPRVVGRNLAEVAALCVSDVDNDGDLDLVSVAARDGLLSWHENVDPDGESWVWHVVASGLFEPRSLAVADLDDDGDVDLVVGGAAPDTLLLFENTSGPGGAFSRWDLISSQAAIDALTVADVKIGGAPEIVVAGPAGLDAHVLAFPDASAGPGGIIASVEDHLANPGLPLNALVAGDLDDDGDVDLASNSASGELILWHENPGMLSAWPTGALAEEIEASVGLAVADVDGNSVVDVVGAGGFSEEAVWYEYVAGLFLPHEVDSNPNVGFALFATGDFSGDGKVDVALVENERGQISWHEQGDNGLFRPHAIDENPRLGDGLAILDINGDGEDDVVSGSLLDAVGVWVEKRADLLEPWRTIPILTGNAAHAFVDGGDIDGDGDVDVAFAQPFGSTLGWAENDGAPSPTFTLHSVVLIAGVSRVKLADADGDGDLDLFSWTGVEGQIHWQENKLAQGAGWTSRSVATDVPDLRGWAFADVNGDSSLDVITASYEGHHISWHENLNPMVEGWPTHLLTDDLYSPLGVAAGDLDGDGDVDVIPGGSAGDDLVWYENLLGDGTSWPRVHPQGAPTAVDSIHIADLDQDGDQDFVARAGVDESLSVFINEDGVGGAFAMHWIRDQAMPLTLKSGDVDGDGDVDLLAADDALEWIENLQVHDNSAPRAVGDELEVNLGALGTVLVSRAESVSFNDLDLNGDALTVNPIAVFGPTHGHLTLRQDGTFTYAHDGTGALRDRFDYEVCDDGAPQLCDVGVVNIRVRVPPFDSPPPDAGAGQVGEVPPSSPYRRGQGCACTAAKGSTPSTMGFGAWLVMSFWYTRRRWRKEKPCPRS
jgi:hypothetical protein